MSIRSRSLISFHSLITLTKDYCASLTLAQRIQILAQSTTPMKLLNFTFVWFLSDDARCTHNQFWIVILNTLLCVGWPWIFLSMSRQSKRLIDRICCDPKIMHHHILLFSICANNSAVIFKMVCRDIIIYAFMH